MLRSFAVGLLLVVTGASACAKRTNTATRRCAQVDVALLARGPVYHACEVDRPAKLIGRPGPLDFRPADFASCRSATIEFVVDERGVPVSALSRVVRTNDHQLADALLSSVASHRYEPALKDGIPVKQVVQDQRIVQMMVTASSTPPRASAPRRSC